MHVDPGTGPHYTVKDTVTSASSQEVGQVYTGLLGYLESQYIWTGQDNVNVSTDRPNVFLKGGPGSDALKVSSGSNVLDGGGGSNFLVGGSGTDTFFTDARTPQFVWNTIVNFHPGDMATLYGFVPGQSSYSFAASEGAAGYQGLTLNADTQDNGQVTAKITMAGLTTADESHLSISSGTVSGIPYLAISNT